MSLPCPETTFVEALRDGRLGPEREGALRTHVTTCRHCTEEALRLEAFRAALQALPEHEPSPQAVARGRTLLLDAARGRASAAGHRRDATLPIFATALALAAGIAFWAARHPSSDRGRAMASSSAGQARSHGKLEVRVTPATGARWARSTEGEREIVSLVEGQVQIAVDRHGDTRRLAVRLPDGELEDEGTVFSVRVARDRTQEVRVSEGSVVLHLAQQPPRHLAAGESFVAPANVEAEQETARDVSRATPTGDTTRPRGATPAPRTSDRTKATTADADACPGAPRFEDCVSAFKRGEYAAAADAFAHYSATCGRHAEDATYLRMVSLARAGRSAEARELARSYLARFPEGFRRKEAQSFARGD